MIRPHKSRKGHGLASSLWTHRNLIATLTRREIAGRYRGSMLGVLWSFFSPLLMLSVYTFVFTEIISVRWPSTGGSKTEVAIVLFAGMLVFSVFAECVSRAPTLITSNPNYVKRVIFPLEILTWVTVFTALFHYAIGLLVLVGAVVLIKGSLPASILLLPIVILPLLLFSAGLCWFLSAIGVYVRDVGQIIGLVVVALMFLSPLFFPISAVPENYRPLFALNPLTRPMEWTRGLIIWNELPPLDELGVYWLLCGSVAIVGLWAFNRMRRGFADVI